MCQSPECGDLPDGAGRSGTLGGAGSKEKGSTASENGRAE